MINSKKKWMLIVSLLIITVLLTSCWDWYKSNEFIKTDTTKTNETANVVEKMDTNNAEEKKEIIMDEDSTNMWDVEEEKDTMTIAKWVYTDYSESKLANAKWDIVLFFHATWCPSCKSADKNLSWSSIPEWLTILKLDYDSTIDLRKKYWVTTQHTFVQVDNKWNMINKWIWSRDLKTILDKVK